MILDIFKVMVVLPDPLGPAMTMRTGRWSVVFISFVFGHNQLVGQPLTVALRERKTLETSFHKIGNALNEVQFNFQSNRTTNHMVYWLIEK